VIEKPKLCNKICPLIDGVYVPSEIHEKSKILYLAEAPGFYEAKEGRPLIGIAGRDFDNIVKECGGSREDGNYLNSVACRPTKQVDGKTYNRTPTNDEILMCNKRLIQEIETIQPNIIICMGKSPYVALGGNTNNSMKSVVGSTFTFLDKYDVVVTYHPAAIAHSGGMNTEEGKRKRNEIIKAVKMAMNIEPKPKQLEMF